MQYFLLALILIAFAVLARRNLKLALTLIIALSPAYLLRLNIIIPWTVLEGMILIAFVVWISTYRGLQRSYLQQYAAPLFFLLAVATFATLWAPHLSAALGIWKAYFIEPFLVFAMLRTTFTQPSDWLRTITALSISVIAISAFAIFQKTTGLGIPIPWDSARRATSFFEYPNAVGLFVAPIVTASIVILWTRKQKIWSTSTVICGLGAAFGLIAIILAETEAALVAIPAALFCTLLIANIPIKTRIAALVGAAFITTFLVATVAPIRQKLLLEDYSGLVRRSQWSETVTMLRDRPLLGAGLSGYPSVFAPYHDPTLYEIFQYPHDVILNFWVEMGIFGVIAFLWLAIITGKLAWMGRNDALVLAAFAALLTMTIHGLVDVPFFKNDLAILTAFFLGMMLAPKPLTVHG